MISKNEIKFVKSLHQKKFRQKYNKFLVEGEKIAIELLAQKDYSLVNLYATKEFYQKYESKFIAQEEKIKVVSQNELKSISNLKTPNQCVCVVEIPSHNESLTEYDEELSYYLNGINDPGNLGTIIRIADWFGIGKIFLSPDTVEPYNPKTIQATMGSFLRIRTQYASLDQIKQELNKDYHLIGADMQGSSVYDFQFSPKTILVIGNESHGLSNVKSNIDDFVNIPRANKGKAESLNAAIATAIISSEFTRQLS